MRAALDETTAAFEPTASAERSNRRTRRIYSRLRQFGRLVASGTTGMGSGLIKALHDSRRRLAARMIDRHRDLIHDDRCAEVSQCPDDAGLKTRPSDLVEQ